MKLHHLPFVALALYASLVHADGRALQAIPLSAYTRAHWLVDIDHGRRLNVFCMGSGSPTVIFEAGGGDDSASFRSVQPAVAATTRTCTYDRAGIGFSDPSNRPATAMNVVADLHRLVQAISPHGAVVLVGHSDGGLYVPLYASTYPRDVAGIVLIDPFTVGADKMAAALLSPVQRKAWYASDDRDVENARHCLEEARAGRLTQPSAKDEASCLDSPPSPDAGRHAVLNAQLARPTEQEALLTAMLDTYPTKEHGMSGGELALQQANPGFGDMPLIVLSAGLSEQTALPGPVQAKISAAWKQSNDELAARTTRGSDVLVPDSHHYIQNEHPTAVIDAIRDVVSQARAVKSTPPS
ncbi:alpha/beta hydrolase [Bacillus sp. NP157]|nr:alpha/beta hydrolase [Bacillus sp. NP157]